MQQKDKLIGILLILICSQNSFAWTSEQNMFSNNESCEFNVNPIFNGSTLDNPYWLDYSRYVHNPGNGILDPALRSVDQVDLSFTYDICKYIYDPATESYIKSACCITVSEVVTMEVDFDANGDVFYSPPENLMTTQLTDAKLIKKYYQDMVNAGNIDCADYTNMDEAGNNEPDIFGINATASVGNDQLNQIYTGFVKLSGDDEREIFSGQEYGFGAGGVCEEGGSGDIANPVGWGSMGETSKSHKKSFEVFFYTLIPIIFILLILKMIGKVS